MSDTGNVVIVKEGPIFYFYCSLCGNELEQRWWSRRGPIGEPSQRVDPVNITVDTLLEPCKSCLEREYRRGYQNGYDAAKEEQDHA